MSGGVALYAAQSNTQVARLRKRAVTGQKLAELQRFMTQTDSTTVRLKVSPEIARLVKPGAPREAQLAAARGALPLTGKDLLTVLFFLCRSRDPEIRLAAVKTLREVPETILTPVLKDASMHPQLQLS